MSSEAEKNKNLPSIVLDTSILHKDYMLENRELLKLLDLVDKVGVKVYLPKVVLDEHMNHYDEHYQALCNQLDRTLEEFRKLPLVNTPELATPKMEKPYCDTLKEIIERKKIIIIDYPEVNTQQIMDRCFKKQKPFGGRFKDTGFKDMLIWETILQMLRGDCKRILFVSKNHKDFAASATGPLHKDLVNDLLANGYDGGCVEYVNSLEIASKVLSGYGRVDPVMKAEILRNVNFSKLLDERIDDIQDFMTKNPADIVIGEDAYKPILGRFIEKSEFLILILERIGKTAILVYVDTVLTSEVAYSMPIWSYRIEEYNLRELGISAYHRDEELGSVTVSGNIPLLVNFRFIFDLQDKRVSGFEVTQVWNTDKSWMD